MTSEPVEKEALSFLQDRIYQLQLSKLPHHLEIRARRGQKPVGSIQTLFRQRSDIVVRRPAKPKRF